MNKLKVGIAGYGVIGKRRKVVIEGHPDLELIAMCDRSFHDDVGNLDGIRTYRSYRKLLLEKLDILFVCLTNDIAPEVTIAGLETGCHIFCEKPPGKSVEDILRVIECEKMHPKLKLMYGFNHRHHDSVRAAMKIMKSGDLGKVINMRGVYGKAKMITFNQSEWRTKRDIAGGGVLLDQGIHIVDLMSIFGGEFDEVKSFISNEHWGYDVEDNAYAIMRTENGVVGMLHSSATQWRHRFHLDINLEYGSLILGGIHSGSKSYGAETLTIVRADPDNDRGDPKEEIIYYDKDPSWEREVDIFVKSIKGEESILISTSIDALKTMKLVFKIYHSDSKWSGRYEISNPENAKISTI